MIEPPHRPALAHHVHRPPGLGQCMMISAGWYKTLMSGAARQSPAPAHGQQGTSVLSGSDQEALRLAVTTLEYPSLVARLSNFAGRPIELIGHVLPRAASKIIARASRAGWHRHMSLCMAAAAFLARLAGDLRRATWAK